MLKAIFAEIFPDDNLRISSVSLFKKRENELRQSLDRSQNLARVLEK
jgi:hypothetical protein